MPRISIGVPFHNVEEYLPQCLDSIIDQTFTDFEVIMVDDGSTDGSFEICQKYAAKDSRFKLFYQENGGVAKARNNCLRHMTGDFITWIDSDDWIEKDYLEKLADTQKETDADIVSTGLKTFRDGNFYIVNGNMEKYNDFPDRVIPTKVAIADMFGSKYLLVNMCGNLVDAELYNGFVFSGNLMYEDYGNKYKLFLKSKKIVGLPGSGYIYRIHSSSIMGSNRTNAFEVEFNNKVIAIQHLERLIFYLEISNFELGYFYNLYRQWLDGQIVKDNGWTIEEQEKSNNFILKRKKLLEKYLKNNDGV
ncbi:glycosyltransferase family 2 protein [Ligilactobacillus salivarius]|uniref:glycosyltransferase family 2 protein n=1 Tax=Ligilactobacillus salivarius TaxID=1624 RepID=UPI00202355FD|nr:glycosyltransferase family 2 protein [Ligilactobacillus salivarius]URI12928.1 glycosyltransferase family 2 protein [Ligilactobacillus salivarius]UUB34760.1 glycosyltransferase family 2 protein [Ligilactobacillus salivarius]